MNAKRARPTIELEEIEGFDRQADVVVVGSGAAGLSAALSALAEGADTVVLEKSPTLGGTTRKSSAFAWYPNHYGLRVDGHEDAKEDAMRYMARLSQPDAYDPSDPTLGLESWRYELLDSFYENAAAAAEALHEHDVQSIHLTELSDYFAELPENKTPRGRTLRPRRRDGEPGTGVEMVDQGAEAVRREGGAILAGHAVESVIVHNGAVVGVIAGHGGETVAIGARGGVVFGSGGFAQNPDRTRQHLVAPIIGTCAAAGNTGDFLAIAEALGAPLKAMSYPWMTLMPLEWALRHDPEVKSLFHPPGDSMLFVNGCGHRTLNEKGPYNETAQMLQRWDPRRARYTDLFQYMIWDQDTQDIHSNDRPANPIRPAGEPAPHVVSGESLDGLAEAIRQRVEALSDRVPQLFLEDDFATNVKAAVERFNAAAREGRDPDFERGEMPIERAFNEMFSGGIRDERNPLMYPLRDQGPYYATIIVPAALDTKGGPPIDREARVLDADGVPIPGLYGAGNCVASPSGKAYWAAGGTVGPAVTFGYLAGKNAARSRAAARQTDAVA
ncbi:MAG: FAD-dependent oxidoreductase [Solirubrobacterales bacterium]